MSNIKIYELAILYNSNLSQAKLEEAQSKIKKMIEEQKGKIIKEDNLG